jgi:hypothetical protein
VAGAERDDPRFELVLSVSISASSAVSSSVVSMTRPSSAVRIVYASRTKSPSASPLSSASASASGSASGSTAASASSAASACSWSVIAEQHPLYS